MGNTSCCNAVQIKTEPEAQIIEASTKQNSKNQADESMDHIKQFLQNHPTISMTLQQIYASGLVQFPPINKQDPIMPTHNLSQNDGTALPEEGFAIKVYGESYYEGFWEKGQYSGLGILVHSSGEYYAGHWKKGYPQGHGTYFNPNPYNIYRGNWHRGQKHGFGSQTISGVTYEGDFLYGERTGQGKIIFSDVSEYEGQVVNGKPSGMGKYKSKGTTYEGNWKDGKMHGVGKSQWINRNNQLQGRYIGEYQDGVKEGYGQYTDQKGVLYKGMWHKGILNRDGPVDIFNSRASLDFYI